MIVLDANVLIYAYDSESERHERTRRWLEEILNGEDPVGLPLVAALAFLRIVTHPQVMRLPMPVGEALGVIRAIASRRNVQLVQPTHRHWEVLEELATGGKARGPLIMDAHIAALAREHGAKIASTDRDFSRFTGVTVIDPLG